MSALDGTTEFHLREVLQSGYIPFTFDQSNQSNADNVSAEFYCTNDVLNYDNYDFIRNPIGGTTYYCVGFNVPKTGSIKVIKNTVGGDGTFNFTGNTGVTTITTSGNTASQTVSLLVGSNYNISETTQDGWTQTSAACDNGTPDAITVLAGQTTTCTFVNTQLGSLMVTKNTIGGDGTFNFTGVPNGFSITTTNGTGSQTLSDLTPGAYSISESAPNGWNLTSNDLYKRNCRSRTNSILRDYQYKASKH